MRQTGFSFIKNYKKEFGGSLLVGRRKVKRPLSTKHPIHLVLKATGKKVFSPADKKLKALIHKESAKFGVQVYDFAVNWTHMHFVIRIPSRAAYVSWIRSLTSKIILQLTKSAAKKIAGVFDLRPYTKIISWGRQFKRTLNYQILNKIEATQGKAARDEFSRKVIRARQRAQLDLANVVT